MKYFDDACMYVSRRARQSTYRTVKRFTQIHAYEFRFIGIRFSRFSTSNYLPTFSLLALPPR